MEPQHQQHALTHMRACDGSSPCGPAPRKIVKARRARSKCIGTTRPTGDVVGGDVGLAAFATLSSGEQIDNPRFYRRDETDVQRVQQRKDAAKNGQNWSENAIERAKDQQ